MYQVIKKQVLAGKNGVKKGFTLIELLVAVLIIGILAAVAVPQYQKAVKKARLAEVFMTAKTLMNAMDMYVLENGYPQENGHFLGSDEIADAELDIDIPCAIESGGSCFTKIGAWEAFCRQAFKVTPTGCHLTFTGRYDEQANQTNNNKLDNVQITWEKEEGGQWLVNELNPVSGAVVHMVCNYYQDMLSDDVAEQCEGL